MSSSNVREDDSAEGRINKSTVRIQLIVDKIRKESGPLCARRVRDYLNAIDAECVVLRGNYHA